MGRKPRRAKRHQLPQAEGKRPEGQLLHMPRRQFPKRLPKGKRNRLERRKRARRPRGKRKGIRAAEGKGKAKGKVLVLGVKAGICRKTVRRQVGATQVTKRDPYTILQRILGTVSQSWKLRQKGDSSRNRSEEDVPKTKPSEWSGILQYRRRR